MEKVFKPDGNSIETRWKQYLNQMEIVLKPDGKSIETDGKSI